MAVQLINVGNIANDGTGDDLREAFIKVNQNFEELDLRDDEQTTASNLGNVGEGVFAQKLNYDLQFKKLVPGANVTLNSTDTGVTINATSGITQLIFSSDSGSLNLSGPGLLNVNGGEGITTSIVNDTLTISNTSSSLVTDTTPQLGGSLDAQGNDITAVNSITVSSITGFLNGNMQGNVWGIDIRDLDNAVGNISQSFDFGNITSTVSNILEYLVAKTEVDQGTIVSPDPIIIDNGSFI
jgi:hypothetical protein